MTYDKIELTKIAKELKVVRDTYEKVLRLFNDVSEEEKKEVLMPPICDSEAMVAKHLKKNVWNLTISGNSLR